jgi:hypothetical protein
MQVNQTAFEERAEAASNDEVKENESRAERKLTLME